jgi:signal transduction histidine kinase
MTTDINPEPIDLHVDADRLCDAISKIGYTPEAALMDLVDNSIAASATHVKVLVGVRHGCTLVMKNAVESYQVVDDGIGMDDSEIASALAIGAARDYGVDSLSKYGMGLKSAGLSLGRRIILISKKNGVVCILKSQDSATNKFYGRY